VTDDLAARCEAFLGRTMAGDAAHDLGHVRRVVALAERLARAEGADLAVVRAAAWLHDCVTVRKDDPDRASASRRAAQAATDWLRDEGFPAERLDAVAHAIEAHSFSAGIPPRTLEARVVQDADRLDALGAIGIARCFATAGALGSALFHPDDPIPTDRPLDDRRYAVDHFFAKLFRLPALLQTDAAREEAARRVAFMRAYLDTLGQEVEPGLSASAGR
jgi:uncharacterized protein